MTSHSNFKKLFSQENSEMMNLIKEKTRQYLILFDLKSSIKNEEYQEKVLESHLEKLQEEVIELNTRIDITKWKIKRAEFILSCEKERHNFFCSSIEAAKKMITKKEFFQEYKGRTDLEDYTKELEKEKNLLIQQLEKLKE